MTLVEDEIQMEHIRMPHHRNSSHLRDTIHTHVFRSEEVLQSVHLTPVLVYSRDVHIALLASIVVHRNIHHNAEPHETSMHHHLHTTLTALSDRVGVHLEVS